MTDVYAERLQSIYKDTSEWLRFAEAKNAALVTFNSVWLGIFLKIYIDGQGLNNLIMVLCILISIPLLISMVSIIPSIFKINIVLFSSKMGNEFAAPSLKDNLCFYKDISKHNKKSYTCAIVAKYGSKKMHRPNVYETDLISQIISVSKVCYGKYCLFNLAMKVNIAIIIISFIGHVLGYY